MALLAAAFDLLEERSGDMASVAEVAARAGLAKGTFYLYFPTREAIYLALLEEQLHAWLDSWAAEATETAGRYRPGLSALATSFARTGYRRPLLFPLAAQATARLEAGVDAAAAHRFRLGLARHLETIGARLAAVVPGLSPAQAADLLQRSYALLLGLWQLLAPPGGSGAVLDPDDLATLRADLSRRAEEAVAALWRGTAGPFLPGR
jgi:AcrR family transcriptional regulator